MDASVLMALRRLRDMAPRKIKAPEKPRFSEGKSCKDYRASVNDTRDRPFSRSALPGV